MQDESTTQANPESTSTPRTFTQAEVDKIVQSRLAEEAKKEREKARNEVKEWFGIPLEEAYKIVMNHQSQPAPQQVAPTPKTDDTPEWAKAVLSKVEKLEQELAQEKKAKRTSNVRESAIKAGVLPELLDFLDPDTEDPDTAISAMLEKQKAVLALAPKKPAPPTLHAGATSQPTKAPSEPDIVDRETAQKILRGGSR